MAERRLDNRRRIEATRRVAFPSNRKPPIHREQKKASGTSEAFKELTYLGIKVP